MEWFKNRISAKYEIKHNFLGGNPQHEKSIRVLNRVLSWTPEGIQYEADQRHADIVVEQLGLGNAKGVSTPGSKDDVGKALHDPGLPLQAQDAIEYRALAARLNYLALDRPDLQYATKEIATHMASPSEGHWLLLKRLDRYL